MDVLTPKQIEIRQRESRILAAALPMIRRGGVSAVSMDAIAKKIRYTRGTVYNHFPNKEDIVLSLAARASARRVELFKYGVTLGKASREKIAAIGIACEVYVHELPDDFSVEQVIRHDSVWQKTSAGRRDVLMQCENECIGVVGAVIETAIEQGDLQLPRGKQVADVVMGLWSLTYGGHVLAATSPSLSEIGIHDPDQAIRRNCNAMLDGIGWQPLFDSSRYNRYVKRILPLMRQKADELKRQTGLATSTET
ncbi:MULTISPECIES: TetR/AcrR family transcriptional regulator [Crateriforma]|uniref:DNA-binding transcriptional repressor AcrR n=1 Tax=Crateriforma conspicua TaxID=2527996 RepID=A0A5C6FLR3_9PLAN|nr:MULTISPECIES: TetR/AcrR family transcriptional regulator [Crateriforma]TWU63085.1 DNA-binding transcriptional repressor AcrR [Crateriforma conspicua]